MEEREFNKTSGELSEESKNDMQPGAGQDERKRARHFVTGEADGSNAYPTRWGMLVNKYLKECYQDSQREHEVHVADRIYTVLRRGNVTAFYDHDGNKLFDVENERLAKEAESYAGGRKDTEEEDLTDGTGRADGNGDSTGHAGADGNESPCDGTDLDAAWKDKEPSENGREAGTVEAPVQMENDMPEKAVEALVSAENNVQEQEEAPVQAENDRETGTAESSVPGNIGEAACEKLRKGSEKAPDREFMAPVVEYLLKRCMEDRGLAEDVMQEHKTWEKCSRYIYDKARERAKNNCAMVRDEDVYEWSEDYFHKDDKAEEEKKTREASRKKKAAESSKKAEEKKKKASGKRTSEKKVPEKEAPEKKATEKRTPEKEALAEDAETELSLGQREPAGLPEKKEKTGILPARARSGKNRREMDGQMDMFAMMGLGV